VQGLRFNSSLVGDVIALNQPLVVRIDSIVHLSVSLDFHVADEAIALGSLRGTPTSPIQPSAASSQLRWQLGSIDDWLAVPVQRGALPEHLDSRQPSALLSGLGRLR
jgi:hypothetical protein